MNNELERAKQQGYIVIRQKNYQHLFDSYRAWCSWISKNSPDYTCIYAICKKDSALVVMDLWRQDRSWLAEDAWREQAMTVCEQATGRLHAWSCGPGLYTHVKHVPLENAEALAQALLILSRPDWQNAPFPPFHPCPFDIMLTRFEASKTQGIVYAKGVADYLPLRYKHWCHVTGTSYMCVWERRRGYAEIKVEFSPPLTDVQLTHLQAVLHHEKGIYIRNKTLTSIGKWLPLEKAQAIATTALEFIKTQRNSI